MIPRDILLRVASPEGIPPPTPIPPAVLQRVAKWHEHHGMEKQRWFRKEKNNHQRQSYRRDAIRHFKMAIDLRHQAEG